jgi:hypothetical protein
MNPIAFIILLFFFWEMKAQNSKLQLNNEFQFKDGIYLSPEDFLNNSPAILWEEIEASNFINKKKMEARIGNVFVKSNGKEITSDKIFGFSAQGLPFIQIHELKPSTEGDFAFFSAFRIRGAVSYFSFVKEEIQPVEISAFNPATGIPFRKGKVDKKIEYTVRRILNFSTGKISDLTKDNLLKWTGHDLEYKNYIQTLEEDDLFQAIILYNERHPFFIHKNRP